ncbi:hypothetical protein V5O48_018859 [Marasmius crinis-equi]|uniref:Tn3 transposase DDE domain-containing protein n=1 Tax=Marasmius crinis-equi TaxID=585013 RepID=A0ABR3EK42_9AGAR
MVHGVVKSFKLGRATIDDVVNNVQYMLGFSFLMSERTTVDRFSEASQFYPTLQQIQRSEMEDIRNLWTICLYARDIYRAAQVSSRAWS